jgi:hypothetical protein
LSVSPGERKLKGNVAADLNARERTALIRLKGEKSPNRKWLGFVRAVVVISAVLGATAPLLAEVSAVSDQEPPAGGRNTPPVLKAHVNKPITLQFILTNAYPHAVIDHVTVLYSVVRVDKLGRKPARLNDPIGPDRNARPLLDTGVVTKGQFIMDFKPDCRVGTRFKFQIAEPGLYSARIETLGTQSDHEHFSAIDFVVE